MSYGKNKPYFKGHKLRRDYDYPSQSFGKQEEIADGIHFLRLNNSISFSSHFDYRSTPKMFGQEVRFSVFVTKNKTHQKTLEDEKFLKDKFKWDDYFYDNLNERIIDTGFIKIGQKRFENGAISIKVKR